METTIWKNIPNFSEYQVNASGEVRRKDKEGNWKPEKLYENATSVGTYIVSHCTDDAGNYRPKGVHYLVCIAFNGPPPNDGKKYEVNHIDGNKHNNVPNNLEWTTRSENTLHALKTGLRKDNLEIDVTDLTTGKTDKYYSLSELARAWNIPRYGIRTLISRHSEEPYLGRWLFKIVKERLGKINRPHHNNVISKNYVTGQILVTSDAAEMEYYTKIKSINILNRVGNVLEKTKNPDALLGGFVFRKVADTRPWPSYTNEEALASRDAYFNKVIRPYRKPFLVKNYLDGTIQEYTSLVDLSKGIGAPSSTIYYRHKSGQNLKPINGFAFIEKDSNQQWLEFTDEEIEKFLKTGRPLGRSNTTSATSGST